MKDFTRPCPLCEGVLKPIIYGLPSDPDGLKARGYPLGGCDVSFDDDDHGCVSCGYTANLALRGYPTLIGQSQSAVDKNSMSSSVGQPPYLDLLEADETILWMWAATNLEARLELMFRGVPYREIREREVNDHSWEQMLTALVRP